MPVIVVISIAAGVVGRLTSRTIGPIAGVAAMWACLILMGVQQQLLSLAVYRFAVDGRAIGGFEADDRGRALQPRR